MRCRLEEEAALVPREKREERAVARPPLEHSVWRRTPSSATPSRMLCTGRVDSAHPHSRSASAPPRLHASTPPHLLASTPPHLLASAPPRLLTSTPPRLLASSSTRLLCLVACRDATMRRQPHINLTGQHSAARPTACVPRLRCALGLRFEQCARALVSLVDDARAEYGGEECDAGSGVGDLNSNLTLMSLDLHLMSLAAVKYSPLQSTLMHAAARGGHVESLEFLWAHLSSLTDLTAHAHECAHQAAHQAAHQHQTTHRHPNSTRPTLCAAGAAGTATTMSTMTRALSEVRLVVGRVVGGMLSNARVPAFPRSRVPSAVGNPSPARRPVP